MDPDKLLVKAADPVSKLFPSVPGLAAKIDLLAKASVATSVAAYGFGFIVSVFYYSRHGVAPRALDHQTYLGAGIAFLICGGGGVRLGVLLERRFSHTRKRVEGGLMLLLLCGVAGVLVAAWQSWSELARWLVAGMFFAAAALCGHTMVRRERSMPHEPILILVMIILFGMGIYPQLPVWLGGGEPQLLHTLTMPDPILAGRTSWLTIGCRDFVEPEPNRFVCRRLYRIYETNEDIYVGIGEWDGVCPGRPPTDGWRSQDTESPRLGSAPRGCYQRISNSLIQRLESD